MATELVTAHSGQNHVGSDDIGALYAGALGNGRFALDVGEGMAVSMTDANTLRIGTGGFLFDGRWVRVTGAEEVKIANGTQGAFRKDLVVYTYRRSPSSGNVETGEWAVIQGTAASTETGAVPPEVKQASILDGDLEVQCPVAEVDLSGLTPTARLLLSSVASLKSVWDSVSPRGIIDVNKTGIAYGNVWAEAYGNIVVVHVAAVGPSSNHGAWTSWKFGQLPVGYRPQKSVTAVVYSYPSTALIQASTDGNLYFATRDSAMQTDQNLDGTLTFVRA